MIKRIFRSICLVAIVVFLASLALIMGALYGYFSDVAQGQLKMQTILAAQESGMRGWNISVTLKWQNTVFHGLARMGASFMTVNPTMRPWKTIWRGKRCGRRWLRGMGKQTVFLHPDGTFPLLRAETG